MGGDEGGAAIMAAEGRRVPRAAAEGHVAKKFASAVLVIFAFRLE